MDKDIIEQSFIDLSEDFEELLSLFSSSLKQLKTFQKDLQRQKKHILSLNEISKTTKNYEEKYNDIIKELNKMLNRVQHDKLDKFWTSQNDEDKNLKEKLNSLSQDKERYFDLFRSFQSITAGLITSTDFQSPSFNYSKVSLAGRQTEEIIGNYNDYKRDQHKDAKQYAQVFRNEYVDAVFKFTIPTYLTNSGMAALATILNFLKMEGKITGPILLGSSSYFQNKELIKKLFSNVTEIHEHETEKIKKFIEKERPSILFFDSLCNSHDIAVPNLKEILKTVNEILRFTQNDPSTGSRQAKKNVYIVIDNTCLAASFQPLQLLGKFPKHIHMIVFESMNKYYQFGMDRAMGGVIYGYGKDMNKLFFARQHSGSILSDTSCYLLPTPNKKLLQKRLKRHERNVKIIIDALNTSGQTIVYPTLPTHPAYDYARKLSFHGSFFTFSWKPKQNSIKTYMKFIAHVLKKAKKEKIQIVEGTSFGMNSSRIYLTAKNTKFGKPFVRFSVGTENRYEIEKIKEVLITALSKV